MRSLAGVAVLILLSSLDASPRAENRGSASCRQGDSSIPESRVELAQAEAGLGMVSRTANSARFKAGTTLRVVKRGGRTLALVFPSGSSKSGGHVDCQCSVGGSCIPGISGSSVVCKADACTGSCTLKLTSGPPPAPDP